MAWAARRSRAVFRLGSGLSSLEKSTFGGGPLVCATALEFLNVVESEKLLENVRARGAELREGLTALAKKFDFIREVRGEGLMIGVELSVEGAPVVEACLKQGLLINCTHQTVLRLLPALTISDEQIDDGCDIIGEALMAMKP